MPLSGNKRAHTVHRGDVRDERRSRPVVGRSQSRRRPGFNSRAGRRELLG